MRIERVNENQIRCFLTKEEMESRKLQLKELAYGTEKAQRLFHELMQEAYARFGFEAESMPVMIEAVPLHDDSLVLIVTRVENPEELDTRFASFAPSVKSGSEDAGLPAVSALSQLLETIRRQLPDAGALGADAEEAPSRKQAPSSEEPASEDTSSKGSSPEGPSERESSAKGNSVPSDGEPSGRRKKDKDSPAPAGGKAGQKVSRGSRIPASSAKDSRPDAPRPQLFTFLSLGRAADAAGMAAGAFRGASSLYRDPADARYYLFLSPAEGISAADYTGTLSIFSEFGTSEYITPAREQHLREHCEVLCAQGAVEQLASLGQA